LHVGKLTCTVTSGVDLGAVHTEGTDTDVGPRHAALTHQRLFNALIRLAEFGASGGFRGIGVFQVLVALYHLPPTHIGRPP
jgi:hypothetical protein